MTDTETGGHITQVGTVMVPVSDQDGNRFMAVERS